MLVDSHCHLDMPEFAGELEDVVDRAGAAGIGHMVTICTRVTRFAQVLAVAERFGNVFCSVGIHPHNAGDEPAVGAAELVALARHPKVVGIGETGLDFHYMNSPKADQERSFRAHIGAARESGLPLIIHTREADADLGRILEDEAAAGPFPGLIHCFSGGPDLARTVLDLGLFISFSGIVTFNKAEAIREVARQAPLDRILVETDAPYLAPAPKRGKRNEPAYTALTAARVAEVRGMAPEALAEATTDNFFRLFKKAEKAAAAEAGNR
ncbi:MAG TPA: TatD family hydrolase [Rhodospirillales bacterium]